MFIRVCYLAKTETLATGICHSEEAGIWFIGVCRLVKTETLSAGICHSAKSGTCFIGVCCLVKKGHCLPAFAVRRNREHCLAGLVMTEPSSLAVQNLFRQFFRYLSCSPGQELFLRTAKNYKPASHFCSNGRTFISTQRSRLFPKAEMSGLFPSDNWSAKRRPSPPAVLSVPDSPVFQKTDGR